MKILNFGSLNIDHVYQVDHIVRPGETLASASYQVFAGGKGANQSAALGRAGAPVWHAGRVGTDGKWLLGKLAGLGVDTHLTLVDEEAPTGHALIQVDQEGHNAIVLFPGANLRLTRTQIEETLQGFGEGDLLLLQNETNLVPQLIGAARRSGMRVCFNPAPFTAAVPDYPLDLLDILVLNEIEGAGLSGCPEPGAIVETLAARFPDAQLVLTLGERGSWYRSPSEIFQVPAERVRAVDTTGAGDTFIGYLLAGLAAGNSARVAVRAATRAAALCITRPGAMDSIPAASELSLSS